MTWWGYSVVYPKLHNFWTVRFCEKRTIYSESSCPDLCCLKNRLFGLRGLYPSLSDNFPVGPSFDYTNIGMATLRVCIISLEPSARIRFKNIIKCPAQSNPYERITPFALRKETRKTRLDQPEKMTRERRFHLDLQDRARSRESKLAWRKKDTRPEDNG